MARSMEEVLKDRLLLQALLPQQLQELTARCRNDPVAFANYFLGMPLHAGQIKFLNNSTKKINILVPSNRWGKTVVPAIKHIWKNYYKHGIGMGNYQGWLRQDYRTANLAPQSAMTEACFVYTKQILESRFPIPQPDGSVKNNVCLIPEFYLKDKTHNTAPFQIFYRNNSTTEFRSTGGDGGDGIAAKPYGYISYDEGSRSNHLKSELDGTILPRLTDWRGTLDITATPDTNSPSILDYYEMYNLGLDSGSPIYYTQEGSLYENTFLSPEAVAEQIALYADKAIAPQVLHGKFVFGGAMIFKADDILAAKSNNLRCPMDDSGYGYVAREFIPGHRYVCSVDTAMGGDQQVYTMLDVTDLENIYIAAKVACVGNTKSPQRHMMDFIHLIDSYNQQKSVRIILETFNGESGRFYLDMPRDLQRITKCFGTWQPPLPPGASRDVQTKARMVKKEHMIVALNKVLSARHLKYPANDDELTRQLRIYKEEDSKIPTDHIICLALGVYLATDGKSKIQNRAPVQIAW